jgi:hypothetical protein
VSAARVGDAGNPAAHRVLRPNLDRCIKRNLKMRVKARPRQPAESVEILAIHMHMVALCTVWYNVVKIQKGLRMTPAMAGGMRSPPR